MAVHLSDLTQGLNTVMASVADTSYRIRPYDDENYHQFEIEWDVSSAALGSEQEIRILNHSALSIYPNPVADYLMVKILEEGDGEVHIELYDSRGRQIQSKIETNHGTYSLDMSILEAGFYMIKISLEGKYLSSRIIIKQ